MRREKNNIKVPLFVLAGGLGTRLRPVLNGAPKSLADVNGTPLLVRLIHLWDEIGISDVTLLLGHGAQDIVEVMENIENKIKLKNLSVKWVVEDCPLGTGGAIKNALMKFPFEKVLVTNSDTWIEKGFSEMASVKPNAIATVKKEDPQQRYGVVEIEDDIVTNFFEKKKVAGVKLVSAGLYLLDRSICDFDQTTFSIEKDFFPKLVARRLLSHKIISSDFQDIGVPSDYREFINNFCG